MLYIDLNFNELNKYLVSFIQERSWDYSLKGTSACYLYKRHLSTEAINQPDSKLSNMDKTKEPYHLFCHHYLTVNVFCIKVQIFHVDSQSGWKINCHNSQSECRIFPATHNFNCILSNSHCTTIIANNIVIKAAYKYSSNRNRIILR